MPNFIIAHLCTSNVRLGGTDNYGTKRHIEGASPGKYHLNNGLRKNNTNNRHAPDKKKNAPEMLSIMHASNATNSFETVSQSFY